MVLTPGNFGGAIEFANVLSEKRKRPKVAVAEMECMIYSGFKSEPAVAWVSGYKKGAAGGGISWLRHCRGNDKTS